MNIGGVSEELVMFSVNEGQGEIEEDIESEERAVSNTHVVGEGPIYEQFDSNKQIKNNAHIEIDYQFDDFLGQPMIIADHCSLNSKNKQGIEK